MQLNKFTQIKTLDPKGSWPGTNSAGEWERLFLRGTPSWLVTVPLRGIRASCAGEGRTEIDAPPHPPNFRRLSAGGRRGREGFGFYCLLKMMGMKFVILRLSVEPGVRSLGSGIPISNWSLAVLAMV